MAEAESNAAGNGGADQGREFCDDGPRPLGRYLLLRRIARGGMGEVFLATTTGIEGAERPVVVKIIRREHASDPSFIARFLDEARVQAQLQHSGVAQVIDATIDDKTGEPYAVVEHVEGKSLGDVRARAIQLGRAVGWADAVALSTLIAEALAHVHERQDPSGKSLAIVHRDLSPQNVMVSYIGECKIIDFGTARGQNRRCHTVAGVVFAKPGYVAPEVANGDSGDARVDIYALGVMLWELCAGRRFLQGDAAVHMAAVARNAKDLPPIAAQCGAPLELDAIIAKLTAFDRDTRYLAARQAAADLARLLSAAEALPTGERGVRARVAHFMSQLFPGEPGRTRREFARLVAASRSLRPEPATARREREPPPPAPPSAPIQVREGEVLTGTRYRLVRELGRGGSGVVYEAEHLDLGRRVALKLIAEGEGSAEIAARFRREARTLSRLSHEGLVAVHDVGQAEGGRLFCVMELLEGETLEAALAREKHLAAPEALSLAARILAALEVAHGAALVHRDIKPANVFLPRGGGVKLLDFGLARSVDETQPDGAARGFTIYGTPEYMAPEQAASGQIDARADLYAVGCVLYEMLTGGLPFPGSSSVAILDAKIKGSPERLGDRVPAAVADLVMKALARHPSQRFQTATEMREALGAALSSPAPRRRGRRVAAVALAACALVAALSFTPKGKQLRASTPWLHGRTPAALAAAPTTAAAPADPNDLGTLDEGEDGDVVDDTLPTPQAPPSAAPTVEPMAAAPPAPAPPAAEAPAAEAPAAEAVAAAPAAEKPEKSEKAERHHGKKRKAKAARAEESPKAEPGKGDKPARRKHKGKVARVE